MEVIENWADIYGWFNDNLWHENIVFHGIKYIIARGIIVAGGGLSIPAGLLEPLVKNAIITPVYEM